MLGQSQKLTTNGKQWDNVRPTNNIQASIIVPATVVITPPVAAKSMFIPSTMLLK